MPILELTSRERSELRSAAHPLRPVVLIGDNGLTEAVLKEIDSALNAHGLIKVRAGGDDREAREAMLATICDTLSCAAVHHLGKTLILYRRQPGNVKPVARDDDQAPKRKASEPYTPKKLAAEGKRVTKGRAPRRTDEDETPARPSRNALQAGRPARPSTRKAPAHGVPRRAGSALSLRAGARRSATGPARKTSRTVKK
ncbi:RNA-binding protein YhbY [Bordetella ansorpii]|uniref:RNA-binding protein YhbY n=1 Tax=Bordetella ansorpii TaxID=288768 RepID=A0A146ARC2_9BORD|nr:YhbY family RNA-binding protein [Bordetella ansorpii]CZZ91827.1 RNA-binding protein YhbY [Bordetella ansorpii]